MTVLLVLAGPAAAQEPPRVVVSIKPVHSLVMALMAGVGDPKLLVEGAASPHGWALKPSQAAALAEADLVVWIGAGLETFLVPPMESLVPEGASLKIASLPGIALLPGREGGVWEPHRHAPGDDDEPHGEASHDHGDTGDASHRQESAGYDPHLWLDPARAQVIVDAVTDRLVQLDPGHEATYRSNLAALTDRLHRLDDTVRARLLPVRDVPFILFHDAYQYFESRYDLAAAGSILLDPDQLPGAARLDAIQRRVAAGDVICGFAEPLADMALLEAALEDTGARIARLDPEGVDLAPGPDLYFELVDRLASAMAACLAGAS